MSARKPQLRLINQKTHLITFPVRADGQVYQPPDPGLNLLQRDLDSEESSPKFPLPGAGLTALVTSASRQSFKLLAVRIRANCCNGRCVEQRLGYSNQETADLPNCELRFVFCELLLGASPR